MLLPTAPPIIDRSSLQPGKVVIIAEETQINNPRLATSAEHVHPEMTWTHLAHNVREGRWSTATLVPLMLTAVLTTKM